MNVNPIISICIPTFNGGTFYYSTLDSIVPYLSEEIELVISDDCSTDGTYECSAEFMKNCSHIKLYKNKQNLGMDRNFEKVAQLAAGKYIWFCGQDDYLGYLVIRKILMILKSNNISILNINFSQYNHDMSRCLMESFFERASFQKYKEYEMQELLLFKSPEDYFKVFTQPPSFLPSVVMLKNFWQEDNGKIFYGTHFIQVGLLLLNMHKGIIGAFTEPLIKGRIPDDQWQANGSKLFSIMCGDILAKKLAFTMNNKLPVKIYYRDVFRFTLNYPFLLLHCKTNGLNKVSDSLLVLNKIYGRGLIFYLYILPLTKLPLIILETILLPLKYIKRLIFRLKIFERLRG